MAWPWTPRTPVHRVTSIAQRPRAAGSPERLVPADAMAGHDASATNGTGFRLPAVGGHPHIPDHAQKAEG
jgi:hypothetical protein